MPTCILVAMEAWVSYQPTQIDIATVYIICLNLCIILFIFSATIMNSKSNGT